MKIKTSELTGAALDWAVAKAEGINAFIMCGVVHDRNSTDLSYSPSRRWRQCGPLIDQYKIGINPFGGAWQGAVSNVVDFRELVFATDGPTPLIAAMRALVAAKLGDEIEVPDELVQAAAEADKGA